MNDESGEEWAANFSGAVRRELKRAIELVDEACEPDPPMALCGQLVGIAIAVCKRHGMTRENMLDLIRMTWD